MGKINVTGNNRVDALDEKLSQDQQHLSWSEWQEDVDWINKGEQGIQGEESRVWRPHAHFHLHSHPRHTGETTTRSMSSMGDSACVGRLQAMQGCVCGRKWHLNLRLECWVQQEIFGNSCQVSNAVQCKLLSCSGCWELKFPNQVTDATALLETSCLWRVGMLLIKRVGHLGLSSVPPRVTHLIADLHCFNHHVKTSRMYWFSKPLAPTPRAQSTLRLHLKSTVQSFVFMVTHLHDVPTNILDKHTDTTPFYSVITTSKRATSICTLRHGHSCLSQALCCSLWYKCITRFKVKGGGVETGPFERLQSSSLQWGKLSSIFTFLSLSPFSLILSSFYFIYFSHTLKKNKNKKDSALQWCLFSSNVPCYLATQARSCTKQLHTSSFWGQRINLIPRREHIVSSPGPSEDRYLKPEQRAEKEVEGTNWN